MVDLSTLGARFNYNKTLFNALTDLECDFEVYDGDHRLYPQNVLEGGLVVLDSLSERRLNTLQIQDPHICLAETIA